MHVERGTLVAADGKVTHPPSGRSATFGKLTHGQKLTKTVTTAASIAKPEQWKIAGTSVPKVDGRAMVTGQHQYASDIRRPDMLYAKVLRPESLGASLVSVDLNDAQAMSGVTVVRDGEFVGVAAPSQRLAEQALAAIKAEWKSTSQLSDEQLFADLKNPQGDSRGGEAARMQRPARSKKDWPRPRIASRRPTPSPTSLTRRSSRGRPWPNGPTAS